MAGIVFPVFFWCRVYGKKNLIPGPAIIASNHQSFLDPPALANASPEKIVFLARRSLAKGRFLKWLYEEMNTILLSPGEPELSVFKRVLKRLAQGEKVVIFPEGTRSPDGQLQPGRTGLGFLVTKAVVPIVPVYIYGTFRAYPPGRGLVLPTKVMVAFGEPISFSDEMDGMSKKEYYHYITQTVMAEIARLRQECIDRL
jgi:1-acyl-sn-glycerol-3-phosphate acyltransferase